MSRSTTALLLSALVFPGAGHLYLKRRPRALVFIVLTLVSGGYFVGDLFGRAYAIAQQIMAGDMGIDPLAISRLAEQAGPTPFLVNVAMVVMIGCWLGAAIDAWMLGRQQAPR